MKQEQLSPAQWGALLWMAALAPSAELLPGIALGTAGRAAWLSPVAALILLIPLLLLSRRSGIAVLRSTGSGKVVFGVCVVWMELLVILRLGLCARRMVWSGERDGAEWYFLLTLAALALWMGQGRLSALGRAGQIFLVMLLAAGVLVLGLSLPRVRADRILPVWTGDIGPVLLSGISTAGSLCWAVLPMQMLPTQERNGRSILFWGAGGCVLLTLAQIIVLGNLGTGLAAQSESAFFALTKSVGIEGAFQRVESVIAALWMLSDLVSCVALTQAIGLAGERIVFHVKRETVTSFALLAGTGGALWLLRWGAPLENWNREWVWMGNLVVCALAALWLRVLGKKPKPKDMLCPGEKKKRKI